MNVRAFLARLVPNRRVQAPMIVEAFDLVNDVESRIGELASSKHHQVAIVCRTDKRSAKAAELLIEASFAGVAIVPGGMEQWQREGLAVAGATTG
jgi:rhodanese-related sulfurtransferase